jgi:hypothetical protein
VFKKLVLKSTSSQIIGASDIAVDSTKIDSYEKAVNLIMEMCNSSNMKM